MSSSVMRELEELRTMLETPRRSFTGTGAITPTRSPELMKSYAGALNTAEVRRGPLPSLSPSTHLLKAAMLDARADFTHRRRALTA